MFRPETKLAGIEIPLLSTQGRYSFPNDNFLNGKTIVAMWVPNNEDNDGFAPSGASLVPNACIHASQLTIRKDADAKVLEVQLKYFLESEGDRSARQLYITGFNPGTTFVTIQDTTTFAIGESIVLMLEYLDPC